MNDPIRPQAAVVKALLKLNCVPVFLSKSLAHQCYYSYCKGVLWPVCTLYPDPYPQLIPRAKYKHRMGGGCCYPSSAVLCSFALFLFFSCFRFCAW